MGNIKTYFHDLMTEKRQGFLDTVVKAVLYLFSLLYLIVQQCVFLLYRLRILPVYHSQAKVISVGNITLGGTGKTPLVLELAEKLKDKVVCVLIRGYGEDEHLLLAKRLPSASILVGRDRKKNARIAEERGCRLIILDDGFQHWRFFRDLDIITIDSTNPFGNEKLIPRGILREPLSALKRAGIFVLTKTNLAAQDLESTQARLKRINPQALIFRVAYKPLCFHDLEAEAEFKPNIIKDKAIALLSAIADPDSFTQIVEQLGARPLKIFTFPDHYQFTKEDLERIKKECLAQAVEYLLTTEKDAMRLRPMRFDFLPLKFLILRIKVEIDEEDRLLQRLFLLSRG
jgi:tetraacyldisaccharide 4'-kinase